MRGTAAWRAAWRKLTTRKPVALVRIDLPGLSIFGGSLLWRTPDGQLWEPLLTGPGRIITRGNLLQSAAVLASATFSIKDAPCSFTGGLRFSSWLPTVNIQGAPVTIFLGEQSLTASFGDWLQRFVGVVQTFKHTTGRVEFTCIQQPPNPLLSAGQLTRVQYPQLPDAAVGAGKPIAIGACGGLPMRAPLTDPGSATSHTLALIAGGNRAGVAQLVDNGRGGGAANPPAKVLVAGHQVQALATAGADALLKGPDGKAHVCTPAPASVINVPGEAAFLVVDGAATAWQPVFPTDVVLTTNYADNPRALLDPKNEIIPAHLDAAAGKTVVAVPLPTVAAPGARVKVLAQLIYRSSAALTSAIFVLRRGPPITGFPVAIATLAPAANDAVVTMDVTTGTGSEGWDFSDLTLGVDFTGAGTPAGWVDVFKIGLTVQYIPAQQIVAVRSVQVPVFPKGTRFTHVPGHPLVPYITHEVKQNVTELTSVFYANVLGAIDDGSGTFTGAAGALIERVADAARYLMVTFAGVPGTNFQTGAGVLGSFVDARAAMRTWKQSDMKLAVMITTTEPLLTWLQRIAEGCACEIRPSEFDGVWGIYPWQVAPAVTYTVPVSRYDLVDPARCAELEMSPVGSVLSGLRISYGFDGVTGTYLEECSAASGSSRGGYDFRDLRDEYLTVIAGVNGKLDFMQAATSYTAVLTPGANGDPVAFAQMVAAQMRLAVPPAARSQIVGWGPVVVAGYNDILDVIYAGLQHAITVPPAAYATFEALCAAVQAGLAAAGIPWTVAYSRATRRVTFTGVGSLQGQSTGAPNYLRSINGTLGFSQLNDVVLNATGDCDVEEERFTIAQPTAKLTLPWNSGPNGLASLVNQSCAELLGFDARVDNTPATASSTVFSGWCPKNAREFKLAASDALYGIKQPQTIQADCVMDTATVREARNRILALAGWCGPRPFVSFSSERHADMEYGDVFQFSSDMDGLRAYAAPASDGLWETKLLRVIEAQQSFLDSWHTDVKAVDLTA